MNAPRARRGRCACAAQLNNPALQLDVDRVRAQQVGLTERDVATNMLVSLSGSFQTSPTFWLNPHNGVSYNIAVMTPQYRARNIAVPDEHAHFRANLDQSQILANLATVNPITTPAVVNHYNIVPVVDVYASVDGRDLGGVADDTQKIVDSFRSKLKPRGTQMVIRGQVQTMKSSFLGLSVGLVMSIVLVYLLIVINFQSWLDPFIIITALPGALAGIIWMLFLTHTTLSVPALNRRRHVHGCGDSQQYFDDFICPRTHG